MPLPSRAAPCVLLGLLCMLEAGCGRVGFEGRPAAEGHTSGVPDGTTPGFGSDAGTEDGGRIGRLAPESIPPNEADTGTTTEGETGEGGLPPVVGEVDASVPLPEPDAGASGGDVVLLWSAPSDDASDVAYDLRTIVLMYSAPIEANSGFLTVRSRLDGSEVARTHSTDASVQIEQAQVTWTLPAPLAAQTEYYLQVDGGAFLGVDGSQVLAVDASTELNFTTASAPVECGGVPLDGVCWYLAPYDQSCTEWCATRGGYDPRTAAYVGTEAQGGSASHCERLLSLLGHAEPVVSGYRDDGLGLGCHRWNNGVNWWLTTPHFDPSHATAASRAVCGCVQ